MKREIRSNGFSIDSALSFTHNLLPPIFYHIKSDSQRSPNPVIAPGLASFDLVRIVVDLQSRQSNTVRILQRREIVRNQVYQAVLIYS